MLARGLLSRLPSHVSKTSAHDLSHASHAALLSRITQSTRSLQVAQDVLRLTGLRCSRSFATTTSKPKSAAKSRAAAKPGRPAAIKRPAKKATKPKAKSKPKPKAKPKKKPAKKPAPKRKVLTPLQKERKLAKDARDRIVQLKKTALIGQEPKSKPATAWVVYVSQNKVSGANAATTAKVLAEQFRNITPIERERLNQTALQNQSDNEANIRAWVNSFTPEQIRLANIARRQLRQRKSVNSKTKAKGPKSIKDERQLKQPLSAYIIYSTERAKSLDFSGIEVNERIRLVSDEWKALSNNDKKTYLDQQAASTRAYEEAYLKTYGHHSPSYVTKSKAASSA